MKSSLIFSGQIIIFLQSLIFLLFIVSSSYASKPYKIIPRLSPIDRTFLDHESLSLSLIYNDLETFFYNQTLDHFNYQPESYKIFQQRYVVNSKYWGGSNAPIFVYFGAEGPIDNDLTIIGFLNDNAPKFKALQVYIEHRYYGKSVPFGSREEALSNASTRGYFSSAQAIADYAEILLHIKQKYNAKHSPIIVIGGSYGGMLASWFRLKYPHIAVGALASSAPILYFEDITPHDGYFDLVTKYFREASKSCHDTIAKSWSEIDRIAAKPNGLSILSNKFHTCRPLSDSTELKENLRSTYATAAQYNNPPNYPLNVVCQGIDNYVNSSEGILGKIFSGLVAYSNNRSCYINPPSSNSETEVGWSWQTCSEMVIPMSINNNSMFQDSPFDLNNFIEDCTNYYRVPPRPGWATTYYGGHDLKLTLHRFASNIIFSNGLRDPYSSGGVLENISNSVLAIHTTNGSHCLDILQSTETDPDWLVNQRSTEVKIIKKWINDYYFDLKSFQK